MRPHLGTKRGTLNRLVGAICVALETELVDFLLHRLLVRGLHRLLRKPETRDVIDDGILVALR